MATSILWIESKRKAAPAFVSDLRSKGYIIEIVSTGKSALEKLPRLEPNLVVVNVASLKSNGKRICQSLQRRLAGQPIILIRRKTRRKAEGIPANLQLVLPFTLRKLENRIRTLVPAEDEKVIRLGKLSFYPDCNLVQRGDNDPCKLTPRLASLLMALINHPGAVLDRHDLFRQVWETDYVGDTRTLDVHISWLRKIIEDDPRRPRRLKTIRGVGYLLCSM